MYIYYLLHIIYILFVKYIFCSNLLSSENERKQYNDSITYFRTIKNNICKYYTQYNFKKIKNRIFSKSLVYF